MRNFILIILTILIFWQMILVEATTCTQGNDSNWMISLVYLTPITILALIIGFLQKKTEIKKTGKDLLHRLILIIPTIIVMIFATMNVLRYFIGSTILGNHLCSVHSGSDFNEYFFFNPNSKILAYVWAPVQIIILVATSFLVLQVLFGLNVFSKSKFLKN